MIDQKPKIKEIQLLLKNAGHYSDTVDGIAGKNTVLGVKSALQAGKPSDQKPVIVITDKEVIVKPVASPTLPDRGYKLSASSLAKLNEVKPGLIKVVKRAIEITDMDFAVNEGLRSLERQRQLVKSGASQTLKSNHITGDAVDLVPTPNGKMDWNDWSNYYVMVLAMQKAAEELNIKIRWGGCWEVINGKAGDPKSWVEDYGARKRAEGKKAFTDGPHFELV